MIFMTPEQEQDKAFLESQIAQCGPVIRQAKIMVRGWQAGGDKEPLKSNLSASVELLGSWQAVEDELKKQLAELQPSPPIVP
jgi:hypothetical protein